MCCNLFLKAIYTQRSVSIFTYLLGRKRRREGKVELERSNMSESILGLKDYTSSALWRKPEQLRGLIKNHIGVISHQEKLLPEKSLLFSSYVVLHPSEDALAVVENPICGSPSLCLVSLSAGPNLRFCSTARWLSVSDCTRVGALVWEQEKILLGCNQGRVFISSINGVEDVRKSSGPFSAEGWLSTMTSQSDMPMTSVGNIFSSPFGYAASTMVRSLSTTSSGSACTVAGVCGHLGYRWDIHQSKPLCSWTLLGGQGEAVPLLLSRFFPSSGDNIILTGNYEGALALIDTRENTTPSSMNESGRHCSRYPSAMLSEGKSSVIDADFNPLLPHVFATASTDGMISIFDLRYTKGVLHYIPSHQGSLTSIKWFGSRSDLFSTGGIDGSVAIWNLRCPPTFCVGRAQYSSPVMNVVTTQTFLQESTFGITLGGELTQTAMHTESMIGLSRSLHASFGLDGVYTSLEQEQSDAAELYETEWEGCGLLYTRQIQEAIHVLADGAQKRLARHETAQALLLVDMTESFTAEDISVDNVLHRWTAASDGETANPLSAQETLQAEIIRSSGKMIPPCLQQRIKGLRPARAEDTRRLAAVRLNALLTMLLESRNLVDIFCGLPHVLRPLAEHPELFEDMDISVVCHLVAFVLETNCMRAESFLRLFVELLTKLDENTKKSVPVIRVVLETAQRPLLTEGPVTPRIALRWEEKFYKDMEAAKDAVLTQWRIRALGVEHYEEVLSICDQYQSRCIENRKAGMFGWRSMQPLLVYLHALIAENNYVAFFWTSVQYLEAFFAFSTACEQIHKLLFSEVDRIQEAGGKLIESLDYFSALPIGVLEKEHIDKINVALKRCHQYLYLTLRVQLECENVAIESQMHQLPPAMKRVLESLIIRTEEVLNSWALVLDSLMSSQQIMPLVRSECRPLIQDFSSRVEDLVEISPKKENDDCLNEILETCDEFLEVVSEE